MMLSDVCCCRTQFSTSSLPSAFLRTEFTTSSSQTSLSPFLPSSKDFLDTVSVTCLPKEWRNPSPTNLLPTVDYLRFLYMPSSSVKTPFPVCAFIIGEDTAILLTSFSCDSLNGWYTLLCDVAAFTSANFL